MCAVWLSDHGYKYDLTTFHSHECHSMLVPKPTKLSEATAIYSTLSAVVWTAFGFCFIATGLLLWAMAHSKIMVKNRYVSLLRTFLDLTNVATSHGLDNLPDQNSVKLLLLRKFAFCMFVIMTTTMAIELPCRYDVGTGRIDGWYFCDLIIDTRSPCDLDIPTRNTQITSVTGEHTNQRSNANVSGFRVENKTLHYLPQGLDKYFPAEKIEFIELEQTGLREIHQVDLKPFTKMKVFSAWNNELRILERDLFKNNPELKFVGLGRNKIKIIGVNVFQNLKNLQSLFLDGNACTIQFVNAEESADYKEKLLSLYETIWSQCSPYYA